MPGLLLAHRHGLASTVQTIQGYSLLGWCGSSRHRKEEHDSLADHVRHGDNGQGRGRGASRRATAADPGREMCRSLLDGAGNNRGHDDNNDGQGKHYWDECTVGGGGRRVDSANNAESDEASGIRSHDGHGHGSAGARRRSSARGRGGSYRERLQRADDANVDSDRNRAGTLASHFVASRSPRVTRGLARQPRTGGETVVSSSTPSKSREVYVMTEMTKLLARPGRVDVVHHRLQHALKCHRHAALAPVDCHRVEATPDAVRRAWTVTAARIYSRTLRSTNKMSVAVVEATARRNGRFASSGLPSLHRRSA